MISKIKIVYVVDIYYLSFIKNYLKYKIII